MIRLSAALVLALFFAFCGQKSPVSHEDSKGRPPDTASLFVTCVTVNGDTTDTLGIDSDGLSGCSLAVVHVRLSRFPVTLYSSVCNMAEFDNRDNDRYVCYPCLKMVRCSKNDSLPLSFIERAISFDSTLDSVSGVYDIFPETTGVVGFRVSRRASLGLDSGMATILLHDIYNKSVSDSTELDTTINLFWSE